METTIQTRMNAAYADRVPDELGAGVALGREVGPPAPRGAGATVGGYCCCTLSNIRRRNDFKRSTMVAFQHACR
jgi:hypothetical protein